MRVIAFALKTLGTILSNRVQGPAYSMDSMVDLVALCLYAYKLLICSSVNIRRLVGSVWR